MDIYALVYDVYHCGSCRDNSIAYNGYTIIVSSPKGSRYIFYRSVVSSLVALHRDSRSGSLSLEQAICLLFLINSFDRHFAQGNYQNLGNKEI